MLLLCAVVLTNKQADILLQSNAVMHYKYIVVSERHAASVIPEKNYIDLIDLIVCFCCNSANNSLVSDVEE